ncbi:MAG: hypothetical protein U9Q68_06080 [Euryarchaeota archaeon]|nr:hypothetical protein [Euryarchaeota archaeon]
MKSTTDQLISNSHIYRARVIQEIVTAKLAFLHSKRVGTLQDCQEGWQLRDYYE